jgi:hypothetical protein
VAGGLKKLWQDQPLLVGCVGGVLLVFVLGCGGFLAVVLLGVGAAQKATESMGIDGPFKLAADCMKSGYSCNLSMTSEEGVVFTIVSMEPKELSCADLQQVLFPHLTGSLETVHARSESVVLNADGSSTVIPLDCTWTGHPSPTSPGALVGASSAAPLDGAPETPPASLPTEPPLESPPPPPSEAVPAPSGG